MQTALFCPSVPVVADTLFHVTSTGKGVTSTVVHTLVEDGVLRYDTPIDWDGNEVRFAVGIAGLNNGHLEILGKIAVIFSDMDEVDKMIAAGSASEVFDLLNAVNEE